MLEAICRKDTALWKSARSQFHHLLMAGMIWENDSKRKLAEVFTKVKSNVEIRKFGKLSVLPLQCYGAMMRDFIGDDHEHTFSVTSLSVQLFTVPTLAHYLIAKKDVLPQLFNTFMSECRDAGNLLDLDGYIDEITAGQNF